MKTKKFTLILTILIILITPLCSLKISKTETQSTSAEVKHVLAQEVDFPIYSQGAVLMEASTGKVLYGKNENEKLYPASTTKILTAIIALEKYKLTDKVTANNSAVMAIPSGYSNAAIQPGEALTVEELLQLFLIHSANEVGYIFAEDISGSIDNFADLMNKKAKEIGCKNTHFTNPSGIHNVNHYSTAYDMALIAQYCMQNEAFRNIVAMPSCTIEPTDKYEKRYFKNTNDLLDSKSKYYYENAIGIKTGFTTQAKNCLIAGSKKDNMELITVVLGAEATADGRSGRYVDTINLFDYGFANYKIQKINSANAEVQSLTIKNATKETKNLPVVLKDNISALVPLNIDLSDLKYNVDINTEISAPITEGDVLGKITYNIDGINYSSDLVAEHGVEKFNYYLFGLKIALVIIFSLILIKLIFFRKKKKRNKKNKNNYYKNYDAMYRIR